MNSFTLRGIGYVPMKPEVVTKDRTTYVRFPLVGQDEVVDEDTGLPLKRRFVSTIWFAAFGVLARQIARHVSKGDHLLVEARLSPFDWTEAELATGSGCSWVVTDIRSGTYGAVPEDDPPLRPAPLFAAQEGRIHATAAAP